MKHKLSFKNKLIVFYMWMKQSQCMGIVETCEYCNSTQVEVVVSKNQDNYYFAKYKCLKCGATCSVREKWCKQ